MRAFTDLIRADREFAATVACMRQQMQAPHPLPLLVNGLLGGAQVAFCAEYARAVRTETTAPVLFLLPEDSACESLALCLRGAGLRALAYPVRDPVLFSITASHDTDRERLAVLHSIQQQALDAVVTTPVALLQYTMPPDRLTAHACVLHRGDLYPPQELCAHLEAGGYARVETVEAAGQYARRGGIIDLCTRADGRPVRLEFFGDEIDRMGYFDPLTQRLTEPCDAISVIPAREVLPDAAARARIRGAVERLSRRAPEEAKKMLAAERAALDAEGELLFADKYLSLVYPEQATLLSYCDRAGRTAAVLCGTRAIEERLESSNALTAESVTALIEGGGYDSALAAFSAPRSALDTFLTQHVPLHLNPFAGGVSHMACAGLFGFRCRAGISYEGKAALLEEDIASLRESGYRILLLCSNAGEEAALAARLRDLEIPTAALEADAPFFAAERAPGTVFTTHGAFPGGFELLNPRVCLLSCLPDAGTLQRRERRARRTRHPAGEKLLSYAELRPGDLVVHASHGIGRFEGMTTMTVDGVTRDYITLAYAGTDKLFLPADRLEMIAKYIGPGGEGNTVRLSHLGGGEWQRATGRARTAARDMARQLISLYAARTHQPGYAFPLDDDMQQAFEDAFPFEETDSQIAACQEIKQDMERPVPMDRLLCGDVGYGKTEVALRAAFKAVNGGKQVALLVPTTILALQHYETALSRMRGFPVTVEMLSRFRTPRQQEQICRRVARGEVDILIGTHKLLNRSLQFRDLGLLIVDEEQRFGVAQKERLKEMSHNVDTLTLTATPIPRTLNMAMSGIRDMSLLEEAPGDRHPVQTYVAAHDDGMILEAIRRELRRGGQVIYLYNRVESIETVALRLTRALPEAHIVVAHGKMEKDALEDIWQAMCRGEIDIIVCTTIVETGVDLPNANTLIIEDADRLGLSQLHQLRGRVGRSNRHAYAYFTYRPGKTLSEIAEKRLAAVREYAAFGAGFRIALRDLELRGAGNLLGAEQHGHIDSVGYDMYIRLLNEAVLEEQGKAPEKPYEATLDLRISAHLPDSYIPSAAGRMEMYKKITLLQDDDDRRDLEEELSDRYGTPPAPVLRLLRVAQLRALCNRLHIPRIEQAGNELRLVLEKVDLPVWSVLFSERHDLRFAKSAPPCVFCRLPGGSDPTEVALPLLTRYAAICAEDAAPTQGKEGTV